MASTAIALVAAQSENRVIGRGNEIPWKVKGEQKLFKDITMGGTLVMGRKTFDSIGRPLPGRTSIIVTRDRSLTIDNCLVTHSLEAALEQAHEIGKPIFVVGGGEIYQQALEQADEIHLTTIHTSVEGDVYFPELPENFTLSEEKQFESNINYTYRRYTRGQS